MNKKNRTRIYREFTPELLHLEWKNPFYNERARTVRGGVERANEQTRKRAKRFASETVGPDRTNANRRRENKLEINVNRDALGNASKFVLTQKSPKNIQTRIARK